MKTFTDISVKEVKKRPHFKRCQIGKAQNYLFNYLLSLSWVKKKKKKKTNSLEITTSEKKQLVSNAGVSKWGLKRILEFPRFIHLLLQWRGRWEGGRNPR